MFGLLIHVLRNVPIIMSHGVFFCGDDYHDVNLTIQEQIHFFMNGALTVENAYESSFFAWVLGYHAV